KLLVVNDILGVFGLMGRLGRRVRAEAGLAYYVNSRVRAMRLAGFWRILGGFNPARVEEAVSMMVEELDRITGEGVSERELEDSKKHLIGSMDVMMESLVNVAQLLHIMEFHKLGLDYLDKFKKEVEGVELDDIREVAEKYLKPEGYVEVVARP
ncbi:MAG: insulinase family protein, partial [Thermoprotei archaeon]